MSVKGMILTLGGSPQPLIKSINHHQPSFICFCASQRSVELVKTIKEDLKYEDYEDKKIMVDDPQDINSCYQRVLSSHKYFIKKKLQPSEIMADITGGTKVMSIALALVAVDKGYHISYVGGKRNKEGLGVVKEGTEEIVSSINPWEKYAVQTKKNIQYDFNHYRYESVLSTINNIEESDGISRKAQYLFNSIKKLSTGYLNWDLFEYDIAKTEVGEGLELLRTYCDLVGGREQLESAVQTVASNLDFLDTLQEKTYGFDFDNQLADELVVDMFSNAHRRAEEGEYDSGVVRLYRTVEIIGQINLLREIGHHTSEVPLSAIPDRLKDGFQSRLHEGGETVKCGLRDTYLILSEMGNEAGKMYFENEDKIKRILQMRNTSFLTHNFNTLDKDKFEKISRYITEIFEIKPEVKFPKIELI